MKCIAHDVPSVISPHTRGPSMCGSNVMEQSDLGNADSHASPPSDERRLIVNADDFGMSSGVNRGILEAHRRGIVTSASLMVRWPAAEEAVSLSQGTSLSLGLHVDLGEWAYREGAWVKLYEVAASETQAALAAEVADQVERFRRMVGRDPSHLDSHQHVHLQEPLRSILLDWAARLGVPLRHCSLDVTYCGEFYGQLSDGQPWPQAITADALVRTLSQLRPGVTELACHPGMDDGLDTMYCHERRLEVHSLCDPSVRKAIDAGRIRLCSFDDLPAAKAVLGGKST